MIYEEPEEIRITGREPEWQATYSWERFDGPLPLTIGGVDIVTGCCSRMDDLAEDLVVLDQCKAYRKGHGAMVGKAGRMPIGAETTYKVSHRYSNNALKVVKDFFVPRGLEVEREIVLDALCLDGGFEAYQTLSKDLTLSDWADVGDGVEWSDAPIVLCLKHASGLVLEIGRGNDLWRWDEGFLPEFNTVCGASLKRGDTGLTFSRFGARVEDSTPVTPRSFRFSWYLAWSAEYTDLSGEKFCNVQLTHRPNGDVAMGALAEALAGRSDAVIALDVNAIPMPDSLRSNRDTKHPCFASNQTIKRLKRVIRQLSGLRTEGPKRLAFTNLRPDVCTVGNHVHGTDRTHWDMASIMDFGLWARQTLGDEWELTVDTALDLPSLKGAFLPTDHPESPIQYEYNPDKQ